MNEFVMMTMTDAGRLSMLNYLESGFKLELSHVAVGSGTHKHSTKTAGLKNKWADFPLLGGMVNEENNNLIVTTMGQIDSEVAVSELGLYDNAGKLFAVVSKESGHFFKTEPGVFFSFTVSIALGQKIDGQKLTLAFSTEEQTLDALLKLHLQHKNPHPQYRAYVLDLLKQHLSAANPHDYALRSEVVALVKQYINFVNRLIGLFLEFFGQSMYMGRQYASGHTGQGFTIGLPEDFNGDLRSHAFGLFYTPEDNHEAWEIVRYEKSVYCHIYTRWGRGRGGFTGNVNWLFLTDTSGSPVAEMTMPELIKVGLAQTYGEGKLDILIPEEETVPTNQLVVLLCPQQHHEGWSAGRSGKWINVYAYRRKNISRHSWRYTGMLNYAVLRPKDGTDLTPPSFFPCLLMAGLKPLSGGWIHIDRPPGQEWDFTDPNVVIQVSPDAEHEAWTITRSVSRISVYVYNRVNKEGRHMAYGWVNFAIFQKEGNQDIYRAGTYDITIPAHSTADVRIVGAGGSGAGSLWTTKHVEDWLTMGSGQDTVFKIGNEVHLVAGGGGGGTRGCWNNGSAFNQGIAGLGGKNRIVSLGPVELTQQVNGKNAYLESSADTSNRDIRGGEATWLYGAGGEGGYTVETRKHRCYGGGGGSGSLMQFKYKNTTNQPVKATLVVGHAPLPDNVTPEVNNGKAGEEGVAMVKILKNT